MKYMEKRDSSRFRINQLIGYYPNREEYLWAEGLDVSIAGMRCSSKEAVDPLTNVFLMIGVPTDEGERLIRCEGHVSWSQMDGENCVFGIHFEHIDAEDMPYFQAYLDELVEAGPEAPQAD